MPKRVLEFFIIDILISIDKIRRYTVEFSDGEDFYYDEKSFDATMRELQIIGEATKHLINGELLSSKYRMIVNFRNLVVHEYFGIDSDEVWSILTKHLPQFETEILELFRKVEDKELLQRVIQHSKDDFRNRKETIKFLKSLEKDL